MKIARLFLAATLLLAPAFPQKFTVLLQRAIFLEETAGDVDGAIQLYRQILSSGADTRVYEAEAQYRLGACLLRKGDKPLAARTFQDLMERHPEETHLLSRASIHYRDPGMGFSFTVPAGWSIHPRAPSKGPGRCADVQDPENKATIVVCAKPVRTALEAINERLVRGEVELVQLRRSSWPDFTLRQSSPTAFWRGESRILTILADYTLGADRMTEWTTWVQSETTRSSVIVHIRAPDFDEFRVRFRPILNSYRIP
jgi:hypothetical protein